MSQPPVPVQDRPKKPEHNKKRKQSHPPAPPTGAAVATTANTAPKKKKKTLHKNKMDASKSLVQKLGLTYQNQDNKTHKTHPPVSTHKTCPAPCSILSIKKPLQPLAPLSPYTTQLADALANSRIHTHPALIHSLKDKTTRGRRGSLRGYDILFSHGVDRDLVKLTVLCTYLNRIAAQGGGGGAKKGRAASRDELRDFFEQFPGYRSVLRELVVGELEKDVNGNGNKRKDKLSDTGGGGPGGGGESDNESDEDGEKTGVIKALTRNMLVSSSTSHTKTPTSRIPNISLPSSRRSSGDDADQGSKGKRYRNLSDVSRPLEGELADKIKKMKMKP